MKIHRPLHTVQFPKSSQSLHFIRIDLELCCFLRPLILVSSVSLPDCPKETIPEGEEWLREIRLDSPTLVVDIMVSGIVACEVLQWIPGKCVPAVVVHGFAC
jgi:hypothetical protein